MNQVFERPCVVSAPSGHSVWVQLSLSAVLKLAKRIWAEPGSYLSVPVPAGLCPRDRHVGFQIRSGGDSWVQPGLQGPGEHR